MNIHLKLTEDLRWIYLDLLSIVVGISGGLGAVAFRKLVELSHDFFFGFLLPLLPNSYFVVLLPVLGGLIVGPLIYKLAPEAKGDGISHIMIALQRFTGDIRKRAGLVLIFTSAITLGSGGSAGREGPIALIGASAGSAIGKAIRLSARDLKVLTCCGVASGIAATFNAPMGGAIFSMEVISKKFTSLDAVPILLAAVVGKAVATELIDPVPEFVNPNFYFTTFDMVLCFFIGPLFGFLSFLWVKGYYFFEDRFQDLPLPDILKPAVGGLTAGVCGIFFFEFGIMGVGYEGINNIFMLAARAPATDLLLLLLALGLLKMLATSSTVGSGGSGGVFAPTLYIGTMFGLAAGMLAEILAPDQIANPLDYGLLGMGALFAGTAGAPLTCIFMITEMTGNYSGLPSLIICCITSYTVARILLKGGSIYTIKLMRKGIYLDLPQPVLSEVSVGEAMHKEVITVSPLCRISEVRDGIYRCNYTGFPVVDEGRLVGMITFDDIRRIPPHEQEKMTVKEVAVRAPITINPHQSAKMAMDIMYENDVGRLAVVEKDDPQKLIGIITRSDVIRAYEREMKRSQDEATK
ncbi:MULTISPECIES: chloride channel protein [Methanothrix]|uniref:Chloride transporter, chloride channel (ClC) family protein n=1 Tax=Methanothrix soehngenii (strain ATCC 5969 / DSM 3671 / JCM 10134 / NBRC 103675 / OCM 69 / GP-6) TaxID=990316 RepID=F4C0U7_METSG|nr:MULTISPECIES: chloride channel protein [Methanothrix]AEB69285.1 chloride transporter, chloride channel (ClC) family protein [Methanothrix soehngenii GP6]